MKFVDDDDDDDDDTLLSRGMPVERVTGMLRDKKATLRTKF